MRSLDFPFAGVVRLVVAVASLASTTSIAESGAGQQAEACSEPAIAAACTGCHVPTESDVPTAVPKIANVDPTEFRETMRDFASGDRRGTVMPRIARAYSGEEIEELAQYYAGLSACADDE
jgi:cytochrome c553